ncbi:MAG: Na+/H+ antiporter NhaA, partial [Bacteroidota bacterium]
MRLTNYFKAFFSSEKAGGFILLACTIFSLIATNSVLQSGYLSIWHFNIAGHPLEYWINDGLMAIFFLLIGLELERELYDGELSTVNNALLPILAAFGGMIVPAAIHAFFNKGTIFSAGAGIPMATDIAFALGILSLLGNKVPASLKVFLTALAVIDDLGAIGVIAVFYTQTIVWINVLLAMGIYAILFILNKRKVYSLWPYLTGGLIMWYCMLHSGIHATITGVLLAFVIPFGDRTKKSPSYTLQHFLHKPVAWFIIPVFALANTAIVIHSNWTSIFQHHNELGIMAGLIVGKPIGILLFSILGVGVGICALPTDLKWKHILGAGMLGGIGFTMSIFITLLAFNQEDT